MRNMVWSMSSFYSVALQANRALSHFGSDTAGVNTTRRYLCEALSFQYRYVPIGLLEVLPGRLNDRPPTFKGRDELGASCPVFAYAVAHLLCRNTFG